MHLWGQTHYSSVMKRGQKSLVQITRRRSHVFIEIKRTAAERKQQSKGRGGECREGGKGGVEGELRGVKFISEHVWVCEHVCLLQVHFSIHCLLDIFHFHLKKEDHGSFLSSGSFRCIIYLPLHHFSLSAPPSFHPSITKCYPFITAYSSIFTNFHSFFFFFFGLLKCHRYHCRQITHKSWSRPRKFQSVCISTAKSRVQMHSFTGTRPALNHVALPPVQSCHVLKRPQRWGSPEYIPRTYFTYCSSPAGVVSLKMFTSPVCGCQKKN